MPCRRTENRRAGLGMQQLERKKVFPCHSSLIDGRIAAMTKFFLCKGGKQMKNMRNKLLKIFIVAGLVCLLADCAAVKPLPPEVNLMGLEIRDITLSHVNLLADLRIYNPNSVGVTIEEMSYTLFLNNVKASAGQTYKAVKIGPQEYGNVALRLSSAYWDIMRLAREFRPGEDVPFSLAGEVKIGGLGILSKRFSFKKDGMLPLSTLQQ